LSPFLNVFLFLVGPRGTQQKNVQNVDPINWKTKPQLRSRSHIIRVFVFAILAYYHAYILEY
jgi:hypothetical protein